MFNGMIFNTGCENAQRRPVKRLFEPILNCNFGMKHEEYLCEKCGGEFAKISNMFSATLCRNCEERNRKEKKCSESCTNGSTSQTSDLKATLKHTESKSDGSSMENGTTTSGILTSQKSPSWQPEFRIGDLVECLPLVNGDTRYDFQVGKIGTIEKIGTRFYSFSDSEPAVAIRELTFRWPVRALRKIEESFK